MLVVVVTLNLLIAIFNFYLAIKLWQFRKLFSLISSALISCENYLYYVLLVTPQILHKERTNIYHFRQQYRLWQLQLEKIRKLIIILNWLYRAWRRYPITSNIR